MDGSLREATPAPTRRQPWAVRLALSPWFHRLAQRIPLVRLHARREGEALFEVVQGFVRSQVLMALVDLRVIETLAIGPRSAQELGFLCDLPPPRAQVLLQAGAALGLLRLRGELWQLTPRGAAFATVPGLAAMVSHHRALYADLADPVGFFRGPVQTQLAGFWPYVFGAGLADPDAQRFSQLMAESQGLVAEDTLAQVDLRRQNHLVDVGGGHGAFLSAVARRHAHLRLTLFDLPQVLASAPRLDPRITPVPGSFRSDSLPEGADTISLIRVLYDHADATVAGLLARAHAALPKGGLLVISEPMSGGAAPDPATDVYFAVYTMAMQTGRTRSPDEIASLLRAAGFTAVESPRPARPFVTRVLTARRA